MAAVFTAEADDGIDHGSVAAIHRRGSAGRRSLHRGSRSGWWAAGYGVLLLLAAGVQAADDAVTPAADAPDPQSGAARGRLTIRKQPGGSGPSDHASFYAKKIPVLHLFTGTHPDYHRPTDTAEKINYEGMERLATMVTELVTELARVPERPAYLQGGSKKARKGDARPSFGSIPDFKSEAKGFAISGVAKDSPAEKGGLRAGDLIVQLGESMITGIDDFDSAIRRHKPGETVPVVVVRAGVEVRLEVVLGEPR
jgi:hypothetical protein